MKYKKYGLLLLLFTLLSLLSCSSGPGGGYEGIEAGNPPKPKKIRGVAQLIPDSGAYLYIADFLDDTNLTLTQVDRNNGVPIPFNQEYLGSTIEALVIPYQRIGDLITFQANFNIDTVKVDAALVLVDDHSIGSLGMVLNDQPVGSSFAQLFGFPEVQIDAIFFKVFNQCKDDGDPIIITQIFNELFFTGGFAYIDPNETQYHGFNTNGYIEFTNIGPGGSAICEGHVIDGVFSGSCEVDGIEICAYVYHT